MIGKLVACQVPSRDNYGKRDGGYQVIVGICNYLGPNEVLGEPIWAVVDRMPVSLNNINQIHETSNPRRE